MKTIFKNPSIMKNLNREPVFNYSAYPLKALKLPQEEKKTYLHIYKKESKKNKPILYTKILPMTLADHNKAVQEYKDAKKNKADNIEDRETDWFASYE